MNDKDRDNARTYLTGAIGTIAGTKAALAHGGEVDPIGCLDAIRADINKAIDSLNSPPSEFDEKGWPATMTETELRFFHRSAMSLPVAFREACAEFEKTQNVIRLSNEIVQLSELRAEIIEAENKQLRGDPAGILSRQIEEVDKLAAENKRLKKFARGVIDDYCWEVCAIPDGGEIQDFAEKLGLIEAHPATAEDAIDFPDFEVGDPIYKFSEILKEK